MNHIQLNCPKQNLYKKGHSFLGECIKEFLAEEHLEGSNQYFCEKCGCKTDAIRKISLSKLPPVLTLQLMRFIYDRQTGRKKKMQHKITFPGILDMKPYFDQPENSVDSENIYELSGVIIHKGTSAYQGHYVAHIRDLSKDQTGWWSFDDEVISNLTKERFKEVLLDANAVTETETATRNPKKPKNNGMEELGCVFC